MVKTSNFHSLLFILCFFTNIYYSLKVWENWEVQSRLISKNPIFPYLQWIGKDLEVWRFGQHLEIQISHLFQELGKNREA